MSSHTDIRFEYTDWIEDIPVSYQMCTAAIVDFHAELAIYLDGKCQVHTDLHVGPWQN